MLRLFVGIQARQHVPSVCSCGSQVLCGQARESGAGERSGAARRAAEEREAELRRAARESEARLRERVATLDEDNQGLRRSQPPFYCLISQEPYAIKQCICARAWPRSTRTTRACADSSRPPTTLPSRTPMQISNAPARACGRARRGHPGPAQVSSCPAALPPPHKAGAPCNQAMRLREGMAALDEDNQGLRRFLAAQLHSHRSPRKLYAMKQCARRGQPGPARVSSCSLATSPQAKSVCEQATQPHTLSF